MDADNLIRMANRVGDFFEAWPDRAEALEGIATHLKKFWDPRMRTELLRYIDEEGGVGCKPSVLAAIAAHREGLTPRS